MTTLCLSPYLAYYEKLTWASIKKIVEIKEKPRENLVECLSDTIRGITWIYRVWPPLMKSFVLGVRLGAWGVTEET